MKKAAVFDISGKYGMFKKPYTPLSPVSFPVPPPTAIMGIVGGIIGLDKEIYLNELNRGKMQFGIKLLAPVKRYRAGLNLLMTHGSKDFRPKGTSPRTQVPAEFIKDASFRIFFHHSDTDLLAKICKKINNSQTVYTPVMGTAQCLAEVTNAKVSSIEKVEQKDSLEMNCCIPSSRAEIHFQKGNRIFKFRLPVRMESDRTVVCYEDVYINENAEVIVIDAKDGYEVINDEKILLF